MALGKKKRKKTKAKQAKPTRKARTARVRAKKAKPTQARASVAARPRQVLADLNDPKELAQYLDLALEGANLGVWDWYLTDNSVRFDRRWAEMLGLDYDKIEMKLDTWQSRVHPEDLDKAFADIQAYMNGETEFYENIHRMKHADGHWVYILDRGRFSDWDADGKPTRFTGTHFDVTKSERYRQKLKLFFENSLFGYAFCDMNGKILECNQRYCDITGYTLEEMQKLSYWDITPRKYEKQEAEQLESMQKTGRYGPYIKEYIHKSGEIKPVELNGFVIEDYDGVQGIWSTVEDLTEKRNLEKQISRSAKLASIGVLAAGVGHEINNPAAILMGYIDKIRRDYADNDEMLHLTDRMNKSVERIASIVSGLRIFAHDQEEQLVLVQVNGLVKDVTDMMQGLLHSDGIELRTELSGDADFKVLLEDGKLNQALINLIANAKDALTDSADERLIEVKVSTVGDACKITVKDNGIGIPADKLEKIFDPFFTTKAVDKGTGLGLSIVHGIVEKAGGTISVNSSTGIESGTEFTIELPRAAAQSVQESMQPISKKASAGRKSGTLELQGVYVVLAEDEPEYRELLQDTLESRGATVKAFADGKSALQAVQADIASIDVIISDIKMPKLDGHSFLQAVRELPGNQGKKVKFVIMTGGVEGSAFVDAPDSGPRIDGVLFKPFSDATVVGLIGKLLGTSVAASADGVGGKGGSGGSGSGSGMDSPA